MNIRELKNEITKGKNAYKAFENAEAVLTEIETLEHVKKDMESRIEAAKVALKASNDEAGKTAGVISAAKERAESMINAAQNTVDGIIAKANDKAGEIIAVADKKSKDLVGEIETLSAQCLTVKSELTALDADKEKLISDIAALEAIKDKARKALGV